MPLATTKEVMTQVAWSVEAPRLPAMVGSETLAMVVSSTCMKVPSARARAVTASLPPLSGASAISSATTESSGAVTSRLTLAGSLGRPVGGDDAGDQGVGLCQDGVIGPGPHGGADRGVGDGRTRLVADVDIGRDAEADAQRMGVELGRVESDAHRDALHDLDPVAGGILRRQQ